MRKSCSHLQSMRVLKIMVIFYTFMLIMCTMFTCSMARAGFECFGKVPCGQGIELWKQSDGTYNVMVWDGSKIHHVDTVLVGDCDCLEPITDADIMYCYGDPDPLAYESQYALKGDM